MDIGLRSKNAKTKEWLEAGVHVDILETGQDITASNGCQFDAGQVTILQNNLFDAKADKRVLRERADKLEMNLFTASEPGSQLKKYAIAYATDPLNASKKAPVGCC